VNRTEADRYDELTERVVGLYEQREYVAALALVGAERAALPTYGADLAHLSACLHSASGDPDAALADLRGAAADGAWWHPRLLLEDDDLAPVRDLPGFDEVVTVAADRSAAAQAGARSRPPSVTRPAVGRPLRALLLVLHGAGQGAAQAAAQWGCAVEHGLVLVAVESTQLSTPTYRSWPDQEASAADVANALAFLPDPDRRLPVVAGGYSAGGRAALLWALSGNPVPVAGVVAVAPAVWPEQVAGATHRPRGVVVIGSQDDLLPTTRAAVDRLPDVRLEVVDGLGHGYPTDFDRRLPAALDDALTRP
jgi:dienelactone hydrolase